MIPPNKSHLQALAGWSIAARGNCSDQQHLALCHFQDGCSELSEVIDGVSPCVPSCQPAVRQRAEGSVFPAAPVLAVLPPEVLQLERPQQEGPCAHRFDIHTQICRYCGLTYLKAMGRKPELM